MTPSITNLVLSFRAQYSHIEQAQTRQDEREKLAKAFSDSEPDNEIIHHEVIIFEITGVQERSSSCGCS